MIRPFQPNGSTIAIANGVASAPGTLPEECTQVALYNTSSTATVYWTSRVLNTVTDPDPTAVIPVAGGARGAMPIPPGAQVRLTVGAGMKKYAVIASAADGNLMITPGVGN